MAWLLSVHTVFFRTWHSPFQDVVCITIAQPILKACIWREEVTGVVVRSKNNRRGRLLKHTNEFTQWSYQCDFFAKLKKHVNWQKVLVRVSLHPAKVKQPTSPPLNLMNDNKIYLLTRKAIRPESYALSGRMWSFTEPLGSHSPCTE